ncbi:MULTISPECIES: MCE family protein [unclassified Nocardioides]|uniref:MCE family protein n=1 Tax=unclassified Nocardioides TaxID=2615069 RepID=UPI0006FEC520|nr:MULTISPECIES: MCE family protein [unclassified Nocardioides]KQY56837.1 virulence factor Mce [Nocardioides sp. Root140]KQZ66967.1 virulence factor Mce [Nocardioides sp. Root151]
MKRFIVPGIIFVLLAAAAFVMFNEDDRKHLTAEFPRTVSVYEGSDVRVLGIPVGQVDSVTPNGTTVKVEISYDPEVDIPADAKAVIVSPSVVGDRFVQLTPVYKEGPKLKDGAVLDVESTSTPLELDEIYKSIDDLTVALGPDGANSDGALTELLSTTAANFKGQGAQVNKTIKDLGKLTGTLDNNKDELFGSAEELEKFVNTLAKNDKVVRRFNASMSSVSDLLAGERDELSTSLANLATALGKVQTFVKDNKTLLSRNIKGLNKVSTTLVKRRGELDEILKTAPVALNNLGLTYNPGSGTLDTSANLENAAHEVQNNPGLFLCSIVGQSDSSGTLCKLIDALLPKRAGTYGAAAVDDPTFAALLEVAR